MIARHQQHCAHAVGASICRHCSGHDELKGALAHSCFMARGWKRLARKHAPRRKVVKPTSTPRPRPWPTLIIPDNPCGFDRRYCTVLLPDRKYGPTMCEEMEKP